MAWMAPGLVEAEKTLQTRLKESQESNQVAMREILQQREEIERLVSGLESMFGDIESSVGVMQDAKLQAMVQDTWEMEMEVQATK
jgi:hypothetical protein